MKATLRLLSLACLLIGVILIYKSCSTINLVENKALSSDKDHNNRQEISTNRPTTKDQPCSNSETRNKTPNLTQKKTTLRHKIDLNSADSLRLISITGIGPYRASQIIKLRNSMHGLRSTEQLMMIHSIDSQVYALLADQVRVDTSLCGRIELKNMDTEAMSNHPILKSQYRLIKRLANKSMPLDSLLYLNIILPNEHKALSLYFE